MSFTSQLAALYYFNFENGVKLFSISLGRLYDLKWKIHHIPQPNLFRSFANPNPGLPSG
jgi:hypothetical protein